jgi:predicted alpha/beta-fold hydrolase
MHMADNGKTLSQVLDDLKKIPFNPRPFGGRTSTMIAFTPDVLPMLLDTQRKFAGRLYSYPSYFRSVTFPSLDETPIAGKLALRSDGRQRPGLIFCHGIFNSKNNAFIRNIAVKAYRDWGYNVLTLDTRAFGESRRLSEMLPTGGWKEGEDIIGAARYLGSFAEVTTVGVSAYSMGATSAIVAAGLDKGEYITGGVLAWNGFSDTRGMAKYISRAPKPWEPFIVAYPVFKACLVLKMRNWKGYTVRDFPEMFSMACKECYFIDEDEAYAKASPASYVENIAIPTLHIHAEDDPVVPVSEARANLEKSKGNPNFGVWLVKRGGHCSYPAVDRAWYQQVLQGFFGAWAVRQEQPELEEAVLTAST